MQLAIGGRLGLATLRGADLHLRAVSGEDAATSWGRSGRLVSWLLMGAREKVPGSVGRAARESKGRHESGAPNQVLEG